jgi:serine/threonine-protein kinase
MPEDPKPETGTSPDTLLEGSSPSPMARSTAVSTDVVAVTDDEDLADAYELRYEQRSKIGEGGMGEVHLSTDHRIGRDVAMKVVRRARGSKPDIARRFLREARVQGQLEHPSIVPVYDLGRDPDGAAYFTMKRVRGVTLEGVLDALRAGEADVAHKYTRHKLLTAFGSVCQASHFAHSRGVLHRDLKPSNVMLGDFGEVYVLDWGLAKTGLDDLHAPLDASAKPVSGDSQSSPVPIQTGHGAVMGTPGYMAPEQITGDIEGLDARTDVYALGVILFEILTLEPLHGYGDAKKIMASTLKGADARASVRAPQREIAPELDAILVRACALEAKDRFATARDLYEALEAFLSGDRDVVRRRELAHEHASLASSAADRALAGGREAITARREAMREVSRAVALDPQNREAMRTLGRLFTEAPRELPMEARRALADAHASSQKIGARALGYAYLSWIFYAPLVVWLGVRNAAAGILCDALWLGAAAASFYASRSRRNLKRATDVAIVFSTLALAVSAGLYGPFTVLPVVATANTIAFVIFARRSRRALSIVLGCLAVSVPLLLERLDILPRSLVFKDGGIVIVPHIVEMPETGTLLFLLLANLAAIVTGALFVARFRDALVDAERRLQFQAWQLRQLVPEEAKIDPRMSETR